MNRRSFLSRLGGVAAAAASIRQAAKAISAHAVGSTQPLTVKPVDDSVLLLSGVPFTSMAAVGDYEGFKLGPFHLPHECSLMFRDGKIYAAKPTDISVGFIIQ